MDAKNIKLTQSLSYEQVEKCRDYLLELDIDKLVLYHEYEAGIQGQFHEREIDSYGGWDSPLSHIRGTFTGHYLSAASSIAQQTGCKILKSRVETVIDRLLACEEVNNNNWFFPIPEKYLHTLSTSAKFWAPQYVCQKNVMGLLDAYNYLGLDSALVLIEKATVWFTGFIETMSRDEMNKAMDNQETGAFLQTWCQLYKLTKDKRHLDLAYAYQRPLLTDPIYNNVDVLSDKHANITIPEIHGVAELFEITGDEKYFKIVDNYWKLAIKERGTYVTGGSTSGEHWTRNKQLGSRLSTTNQEHCTVYNLIWLADYLYNWTGKSEYQDYIELNIYNGIFAQTFFKPLVHDCQCTERNPEVLTVAYYVPMVATAEKKWGSKFEDFWCCHCTAIQANARLRELIMRKRTDTIYINQLLECSYQNEDARIDINLNEDQNIDYISYTITKQLEEKCFTRIPNWVTYVEVYDEMDEEVIIELDEDYIDITRFKKVTIHMYRNIQRVYLDNELEMFGLRYGPVVLVAVDATAVDFNNSKINEQLIYQNSRNASDWNVRFIDSNNTVFLPIYKIGKEKYTMYFRQNLE